MSEVELKAVLPTDTVWLGRMRQSGLLSALSDRNWRTLSTLLTFADAAGRCRVNLDEMGLALGTDKNEVVDRLGDLVEVRFHDQPLVRVLRGPGAGASSTSGEELTFWLSGAVWERTGEADEEHNLRPVYQFAERVFNRALANSEILAVRQWREQYGFSREVIIELLEECYTKGKRRLSYMNAVARGWYDDGVRTLEDLSRRREQDQETLGRHTRIIKYLNLGRNLTQPEKAVLHRWTWEWGFSDEVILRACDVTVSASRPSFSYIDKVLANWRLRGVRTVEDAERVLAEREQLGRGGVRVGQTGTSARRGAGASASQPSATARKSSGTSRPTVGTPREDAAPDEPRRGKYDHLILG